MSSKAYFDRVAAEWDSMRSGFFPEKVRVQALEKAGVKSGQSAADVGAGTGFLTEALLGRGLSVVAIDQSTQMLHQLSAKFRGSGDLECYQGESEHLPLQDRSMDYVFANMYLHHVESPENAISEMARVLKPGGKLVITDLDSHHFRFLIEEQNDRWMGFDRQDINRWYLQAGLKDVSLDCVNASCCASSASCGDEADISIFLASGIKDEC